MSTLGAFCRSTLGQFIESPLGARGCEDPWHYWAALPLSTNQDVQKIAAGGVAFGIEPGGDFRAYGVDVDSTGQIWVACGWNPGASSWSTAGSVLRLYDASGTLLFSSNLGGTVAPDSQNGEWECYRVLVDDDDNVYVTGPYRSGTFGSGETTDAASLWSFDSTGTFRWKWLSADVASGTYLSPVGVELKWLPGGDLALLTRGDAGTGNRIHRITTSGSEVWWADGFRRFLAVDTSGNVYNPSLSSGYVQRLAAADGSQDWQVNIGTFGMNHLVYEPVAGRLWIGTEYNAGANMRVLDPSDGSVVATHAFGTGEIYAVKLAPSGLIFTCDSGGTVRVIDPTNASVVLTDERRHRVESFGPISYP